MAIGTLPDSGDDAGADDGGETIFAEINITPLTDVFLVMLIIFMVSALATVQATVKKEVAERKQEEAAERQGFRVDLPSGAAKELDPAAASLVIVIPIQGPIAVAGKAIDEADIDNLFRAAYARNPKTQVVLKADKGAAHGRVVNVMERAKQVGLTRLAIATAGG